MAKSITVIIYALKSQSLYFQEIKIEILKFYSFKIIEESLYFVYNIC